jgi:hypothetical protein
MRDLAEDRLNQVRLLRVRRQKLRVDPCLGPALHRLTIIGIYPFYSHPYISERIHVELVFRQIKHQQVHQRRFTT